MRALILSLVSATLVLAGADGASAQITPTVKVVQHGQTLKFAYFSELDPDCRAVGVPTIDLVAAPESGQVETDVGQEFPNFPSTNVRFPCDKRRARSAVAYYRADPDFTGTVSLTLEVVFSSGSVSTYAYTFDVR